ncbi:hypothetical protein [Phocaeicola plebeius]|uniref:hypothetical protein n=1 Tax=Phocaeicola plebeius TaxID=310297 RepID=UPI003AF0F24C
MIQKKTLKEAIKNPEIISVVGGLLPVVTNEKNGLCPSSYPFYLLSESPSDPNDLKANMASFNPASSANLPDQINQWLIIAVKISKSVIIQIGITPKGIKKHRIYWGSYLWSDWA